MIESAYSRQVKKGEQAATWSFALATVSLLVSFLVCGSNLRGIAYMTVAYAFIAIGLGIYVLVNKRQKKKPFAIAAFIFSALALAFSYGILRNVDLCFCPQTRKEASTPLPEVQKTSPASTY
jgi:heme O synthase-like polyprenyltransferase